MENSEKEFNQQQTYLKDSFDATKEKENYLLQSTKFENTKKYLNKVGNYYINHMFSLLGYQYKGKLENVNILHLCAEAWLLGAFNEMKKENNEKIFSNQMITYSQLLSQIKQIIVEENNFIDNVNLLTGLYGLKEFSIEDKNIFKMFLVNIQATKHQLFIEDNEELSKQKFEEIILRIFRMAFNYTLNEFNSDEKDKKSLDMFNTFLDMNIKEESASLENFVKSYYEKKEIKSFDQDTERRLLVNLEYYYNFLNTSLGDLIEEIELFNNNSSSVVYKLKTLLSFKNLQRLYIKYFDLLANYVEKGLRNLKLESVINFTKNAYDQIKSFGDKSLAVAKKNYGNIKEWVNSAADKSYTVYDAYSKNIFQYTTVFYQAAMKYTENPRRLVDEKVYQPVKNLTINVKDMYVKLVVGTFEIGKNRTIEFKNLVQEKAKNLKVNVLGEEPLVKLEEDTEDKNYLNISISKRLFIISPNKAKEFINSIMDLLNSFSITNIGMSAYNYTKGKIDQTRDYVFNTYRKFLELANEEENEDDLVIESLSSQNKRKEKVQ
jgi:hypothetical protein